MSKPTPDPKEIKRAIDTLCGDNIVELRVLHKKRQRRDAGYYDAEHRDEMVEAAVRLNRQDAAVYITLNPVDPQLLGRYSNRMEDFAKATTTDLNIIKRVWLPIDIDPVRPADTSATAEQVEAARQSARSIFQFFREQKWPDPISAESGNGFHLFYRIDLPNDDVTKGLIKDILKSLAQQFDTDMVTIDQSVFNASRIIKLHGTVATKGDHTENTPWRLSRLTSTPAEVETVSIEQLHRLAPEPNRLNSQPVRQNLASFDLNPFLARLGIDYQHDIHEGRDRYKLEHCPFNSEHGRGESAIFRAPSGSLGFKCQHNSCQDKHWQDVREFVDGPRINRSEHTGPVVQSTLKTLSTLKSQPTENNDWEEPLLFGEVKTPNISTSLLPGWLGQYAKAVASTTQTPEGMSVMLALAATSTALQKRFVISPYGDDYQEPLNLWLLTALPPASRKTAVISAMTEPLQRWEKDQADFLEETIRKINIRRSVNLARIAKLTKQAANEDDDQIRETILYDS